MITLANDDLIRARQWVLEHAGEAIRKSFMPVAYQPIPGYPYAAIIDAAMAHVTMVDRFSGHEALRDDVTGAFFYATLATAASYGMPSYHVGADILGALQLSRAPSEMAMDDLHLPFPGMIFVLPTASALRSPDGSPYQAIGLARVPQGGVPAPWLPNGRSCVVMADPMLRRDVDMFIACAWSADTSPAYGLCRGWEGTVASMLADVHEDDGVEFSPLDGVRPLPADDRGFLDQVAIMALKLAVCAVQGQQLVEDRRFLKRARFGVSHGKVDLYEPRWLGRTYRLASRSAPSGRSHASPRMHWRCGHFRRVVCGQARQDRRVQWIEPTLVCPAEAMAS